eukprot:TRINITY_DN5973_c0_g1_i2.p1 TRINITY_DN5973_c0_g1~~TRINITY_DN5973_c0_g1_i2.p1  ORF type:complete len:140 (-),score=19.42 TRINITY_DN5973_c0_g1_i2:187-606(-)
MYINQTNALADEWSEHMHFVLVYTVDAHPAKPDPSPYKGVPWTFQYSTHRQPMNYSTRVEYSKNMSASLPSDKYTIVVDDLTPHNVTGNNPVWCSWGPAPNAAWLIKQDSKVVLAQSWFNYTEMNSTIGQLVGNMTTRP